MKEYTLPSGYCITGGKIIVDEVYQKIVVQIFTDYESGLSLAKIAQKMRSMNVENSHGQTTWSSTAIRGILTNTDYLGTEYFPQIIDRELFDRVQKRRQEQMKARGKGAYRPNKRERELFTGVLFCAVCGKQYRYLQPSRKADKRGPMWQCENYTVHKKETNIGVRLTEQQVEEPCIKAINLLIEDERLAERYKPKEQKESSSYRKADRKLREAEELTPEEKKELLYERAVLRYETLEVRDEEIKTQEMKETLIGQALQERFNETLYRKLIRQILVCTDGTVDVVFRNGSRVKIKY